MPVPALRRFQTPAIVAGALVAAGVLLRVTVFAPDPVPVQVATLTRGRVEQTVTNSRAGTVKARRRAKLSPQEGGLVVALPKRKGDRVRAGEILLELDASVPRARLDLALREHDAALAEERRACLTAERAQRELARHQGLARQGVVAADLLDQIDSAADTTAAACEAARAGAKRAQAQIALTTRQLDYTVLRAPFDGIVADLAVEVGEWSTPSPPVIQVPSVIDVIDPSSIYVSAPMDEVDSARLRPSTPARVAVDSHPGQHFPGRVVRVAAYVLDREEQNRTVEIEVELDDAAFAATLLPGTSADVEVILDARDDVLRMPTAALLTGDKTLVVVGRRLEERAVTIGLKNWDVTEVQGGLEPGAQVVVSLDRAEVQAGARVTVTADAAP